MKRAHQVFVLMLLAQATTLSLAEATVQGSDYMTVGLRVAALIAQQRLASPPLPNLGESADHHFTPQVAYLTGKINGDFGASEGQIVAGQGGYKGTPQGYGFGLAYRSPSIGRVSLFAFGLYTHSSSNYSVDFNSPTTTPNLSINNSKTDAQAAATGASVLLLGDGDSIFALGAFGGAYYSKMQTQYDYDYDYAPAPGYDTRYHHFWRNSDYGFLTGLNAKIRIKKFSISGLIDYSHDFSDHCAPESDAAGNHYACNATLDNSFTSYGVSVGYHGFGLSVYSKLNSKIQNRDVRLKKYQATYTFSF